jgi:hypothetical protein
LKPLEANVGATSRRDQNSHIGIMFPAATPLPCQLTLKPLEANVGATSRRDNDQFNQSLEPILEQSTAAQPIGDWQMLCGDRADESGTGDDAVEPGDGADDAIVAVLVATGQHGVVEQGQAADTEVGIARAVRAQPEDQVVCGRRR